MESEIACTTILGLFISLFATPYPVYSLETDQFLSWKDFKPIIIAEYCEIYRSEFIQNRFRKYEKIAAPSLSQKYVEEYLESKYPRRFQESDLYSICL